MIRVLPACLWIILAGCTTGVETVQMFGTVHDAPATAGGPVEGAELQVEDLNDLTTIGTATTDGDGAFSVATPAGLGFYLAVRREGYAPTHYSGVAGLADFDAGEGYPWIAPTAWVDALREEFANCPTVNEPGAIVTGEAHLWITDVDPTYTPRIDTVEVHGLSSADEVTRAACYLDDEGVSLADGTQTGATGRFAMFVVPEGLLAVEVMYHDPGGDDVSSHPEYNVDADGVVPLYPAWVYTTNDG